MLVTRRQLNVDRWRDAGASAQISLNTFCQSRGIFRAYRPKDFLILGELQEEISRSVILVVVIQEAVMGGPQRHVAAAGAGVSAHFSRGRAVF